MKKTLFLSLVLFASIGFAQVEVTPPSWEPFIGTDPFDGTTLVGKGYARHAVTTAVQLSAAPAAGAVIHRLAKHAIIHVEVGQIRIRTDGTNPTISEGQLIDTGEKLIYENQRAQLLAFRMISVSGTATVTVTYGR